MADLNKLKKQILADGVIDAAEAAKLRKVIFEDGVVDDAEAAFLTSLRREAKEVCPEFEELFFEALEKNVLADGVIDAGEARRIRDTILADGVVDKREADFLVALRNDARETCPEFEDFFFEALEKHLLADGVIDAEEAGWVRDAIMADGVVDQREVGFLVALRNGAREVAPAFETFFFEALQKNILADGDIDEEEAGLIRDVVMADEVVDRREVDFLIALRNGAKKTCPAFDEFFFQALEKNILADGKIDDEEARWIRDAIMADAVVDEREKAFLRRLKSKAKKTCAAFDAFVKKACGG